MTPPEVQAIADRWGGPGEEVVQMDDVTWGFEGDGYHYVVYGPNSEFPCYEDSGRPAGKQALNAWVVRCINDAPDAWWTVELNGKYQPYNGPAIWLWGEEDETRHPDGTPRHNAVG